MFRLWVLFAVACFGGGANASFSRLYCDRVIEQNVQVYRPGETVQFTMRDQKVHNRGVLQALLPTVPAKRVGSYGCVRYSFEVLEKLCTFDPAKPEAFRCEWTQTEPTEMKVTAQRFCHSKDKGDTYTVALEAGSVELLPGGDPRKETLQFKFAFQPTEKDSPIGLESVVFKNHSYSMDGFRQNPECRVDGRARQ